MISINGELVSGFVGKSVAELLAQRVKRHANVVVEVNGEIVHRTTEATVVLKANDHVELISFVGGG